MAVVLTMGERAAVDAPRRDAPLSKVPGASSGAVQPLTALSE